MTLRLKAQSRTFPFPTFDGCTALMQYLLGKGDEVWKEWRASLWYIATLANGILQPNGIGDYSIVLNGDGFTSSLPQLGAFFFIILKIKYRLMLQTTLLSTFVPKDFDYYEHLYQYPDIEIRVLPHSCLTQSNSKLFLRQIKLFLAGQQADQAYNLLYLCGLQERKNAMITGHRKTKQKAGQAIARTWNADPAIGAFEEHASVVLNLLESID